MIKILGTVATLLMTTASVTSAEQIRVSNIEVTAEFTDMDASALTYWPNIESDLGVAIAALVVDLQGTVPFDVKVRIEELSLDGAPVPPDTGEFNHMRGRVLAVPEGTTVPLADFPVELFATSVAPANVPKGAIVIQPVDGEFYAALINSFAGTVAGQLAMIDTKSPPPAIFEETETDNDNTEAAPAEDEPIVEAPAEEAEAEDAPVEEAPTVDEAPVGEDAPVEAPVEGDAEAEAGADE